MDVDLSGIGDCDSASWRRDLFVVWVAMDNSAKYFFGVICVRLYSHTTGKALMEIEGYSRLWVGV